MYEITRQTIEYLMYRNKKDFKPSLGVIATCVLNQASNFWTPPPPKKI